MSWEKGHYLYDVRVTVILTTVQLSVSKVAFKCKENIEELKASYFEYPNEMIKFCFYLTTFLKPLTTLFVSRGGVNNCDQNENNIV